MAKSPKREGVVGERGELVTILDGTAGTAGSRDGFGQGMSWGTTTKRLCVYGFSADGIWRLGTAGGALGSVVARS